MRSAQAIRTAVVSSYRSEGSLYKVLQRQYRSKSGRPVADDIARAELLPFKHLPEQEALAAFVEYTLLKELPTEANTALLEAAIRKGPRSLGADDRETLKAIDAKGFMFHWGQLLQSSSDIALMDERPPDDEIERAYLAIRKDLLGEYGRPRELSDTKDSPAEFRQSQMLVWKLPDSILTLSYGLLRDGVPPT